MSVLGVHRGGRYPTRGYQQRQPSLERAVADQADLKKDQSGKSGLTKELTTLRRENLARLTADSHINDRWDIRAVRRCPTGWRWSVRCGRLA